MKIQFGHFPKESDPCIAFSPIEDANNFLIVPSWHSQDLLNKLILKSSTALFLRTATTIGLLVINATSSSKNSLLL